MLGSNALGIDPIWDVMVSWVSFCRLRAVEMSVIVLCGIPSSGGDVQ